VAYGDNNDEVFLGMQVARTQNVAEATAQKIDAEVKRLVDEGYQRAKQILIEKAEDHRRLSEALLEYETLSGEEMAAVIRGAKLGGGGDGAAAALPPAPALPVTDEDDAPSGVNPNPWGGAAPQGA